MPWYLLALLGAALDATYYALVKKYLDSVRPYILGAGAFLSAGFILCLVSLIRGIPAIGPDFYLGVVVTSILNIIAIILSFKALRTTDISLALPMLSFTPVFVILTSYLVLHEVPSRAGIAGIILVVIGSYILNLQKNAALLEPFRQMFKNKGIFYMLIVAFLYSSSVFDKMVVVNSDTLFGTGIITLIIGSSFLVLSLFQNANVLREIKLNLPRFLLLGAITFLIALTVNTAFTMNLVANVISIKRLSILFAVLFGGLVLKEANLAKRLVGAAIMVAGMAMIVIFD